VCILPRCRNCRGIHGERVKGAAKSHLAGGSFSAVCRTCFLLPVRKVREFLVIDVKKSDGTFSRHEVLIPPLSELPVEGDSGEAPVLSAVQVLQVKPGVFLTATVGWQADKITDALVRYGEQELSQVVGPVSRLGREHQVVLQNLRADRSYRFTVVSTDLFGRSQESEPVTFSTADFPIPATSVSPDLGLDPGNAGFVHRFKRHGSDYLLELTFDSPAQILVGSRGKVRGEGLPADEFHEGLSGKPVMSMKACYNCHKPHLHPLDVAPAKPGVIIPADFPTLSGGRITCTSCHVPHSTQNDFYLRKPDKQELCASCHPKWVKLK
jgi:predicted CXXCH cytochrome family protein